MDSYFSTYIQKHVKDTFCWTRPIIYINLEGSIIISLNEAMGINARVPNYAPEQPDHYLKGSKFQLLEYFSNDMKPLRNTKKCSTKITSLVMTNFWSYVV